MNLDYAGLASALAPEAALTLGALVVLGLDLGFFRRRSPASRIHLSLGVAASSVVLGLGLAWCHQNVGTVFGGAFTLDRLAVATRCGALGLTLLILGFVTGGPPPRNPAEYVALILFATVGITLMAAAQHLLIAFLALELTSLSLYALVAFENSRRESAEAALKYFLYGGISVSFLLFGFSLLYGLTGALDLPSVAAALARQGPSPLLSLALVMILVAFGYKTAAAPFHLWAPDAYQGAPAPIAGLIASGSKLGGLVMFTRLLWPTLVTGSASAEPVEASAAWLPTMAAVSAASLLLGNLAALAQTNLRRLLAYSAIAHAGSLALGVMITGPSGAGPLYYYALTYGVATAGAFGVIAALERSGSGQRLADLAGLTQRSPLLAGCLAVFILSLAGIPPLSGFFGKVLVYSAALKIDGLAGVEGWLALGAIGMSVVSLYYYLLILKQAWIAPAPPEAGSVRVPRVATLALGIAAGAVVALGLFPHWILDLMGR